MRPEGLRQGDDLRWDANMEECRGKLTHYRRHIVEKGRTDYFEQATPVNK